MDAKQNRIGTEEVVDLTKFTIKPKKFSEPQDCACCGRKQVMKIHVLRTGHTVGADCALVLDRPDIRVWSKPTKKVLAFFAANGLEWNTKQFLEVA